MELNIRYASMADALKRGVSEIGDEDEIYILLSALSVGEKEHMCLALTRVEQLMLSGNANKWAERLIARVKG